MSAPFRPLTDFLSFLAQLEEFLDRRWLHAHQAEALSLFGWGYAVTEAVKYLRQLRREGR